MDPLTLDWRVLSQLLLWAFGAGLVVMQLRQLNKTADDTKKEIRAELTEMRREFHDAQVALSAIVADLRERTSSLEAFRAALLMKVVEPPGKEP